jgi:hypothetical protein
MHPTVYFELTEAFRLDLHAEPRDPSELAALGTLGEQLTTLAELAKEVAPAKDDYLAAQGAETLSHVVRALRQALDAYRG